MMSCERAKMHLMTGERRASKVNQFLNFRSFTNGLFMGSDLLDFLGLRLFNWLRTDCLAMFLLWYFWFCFWTKSSRNCICAAIHWQKRLIFINNTKQNHLLIRKSNYSGCLPLYITAGDGQLHVWHLTTNERHWIFGRFDQEDKVKRDPHLHNVSQYACCGKPYCLVLVLGQPYKDNSRHKTVEAIHWFRCYKISHFDFDL